MAVGYEKLNTSGARAKRRGRDEIPREKIKVVDSGALIWDATYGEGKTLEAFVSDCDRVNCSFESGYIVTLLGSAVRCGIADREKKERK